MLEYMYINVMLMFHTMLQRPMWLELHNVHSSALTQSPTRLILKLGDDLRQDMITLRMFSLFEKVVPCMRHR